GGHGAEAGPRSRPEAQRHVPKPWREIGLCAPACRVSSAAEYPGEGGHLSPRGDGVSAFCVYEIAAEAAPAIATIALSISGCPLDESFVRLVSKSKGDLPKLVGRFYPPRSDGPC